MRSRNETGGGSEALVVALLERAADVAAETLGQFLSSHIDGSARAPGHRHGQYALDLTVDHAVLEVLAGAGVGVVSEESGLTDADSEVVVVVDPVDGSTNAARGIPWYACSLCAVDATGPWISLVANLASGIRYTAVRGAGAFSDGTPISVAAGVGLSDALVVLNGHPPAHFGWRQYRAFGATALDICAVADGTVDATIDCTHSELGPWDYMGAMLVLGEAGGVMVDAEGRDLVTLDPSARRTPVSASSPELLTQALAARGTG